MLTLLNSAVLTDHGIYRFEAIALDEVRRMLRAQKWQSAIGHAATAAAMSAALGMHVPKNRIDYRQQPGERALVMKLRRRAPEGAVLDAAEIERIGYQWGLLTRIG